ncbi:MAG: pyridoxal phosphate-dependent aminotransferase [Bacteroidetes bacterium]|nr:pyridoxal phosphate-dependent aminotransferase [Bacteroidota bacterium]
MLSELVSKMAASKTMEIAAKAIALKLMGESIIDLSVGEPDFPTPQKIKDAACKAIAENKTKYTLNQGLEELRSAVCARFKIDHGVNYKPDEIIVSTGAKQVLFNAILAVVNPGDEVIIPIPYYVSYPEMVKVAGGIPLFIETSEEQSFKISPEQLQNTITNKTRLIVLCSPSNPTGAAYTKNELKALSEIIIKNNLLVIIDEIYNKLVYDGFEFTCLPSLSEEIKKRTILVNGVSKTYAMTGWRIGYAAAEKSFINAMNKIQSHNTSNAATISQYAALEALTGPQDEVEQMRKQFEERRNYFYDRINSIDGISVRKPEGAFYLFVNIKDLLNKKAGDEVVKSSADFALKLLEKKKIVTVPGSAFGAEGYVRITFANSIAKLERAAVGIEDFRAGISY